MGRHNRTSDAERRITTARLTGTATRLLDDQKPGGEAVVELHRITADPRLLADAGGAALGAWRANHVTSRSGRNIARLMVLAGADEKLLQQVADATAERMAHRNAYGS